MPQDHLLRDIDRVLDLSNLREHLALFYSHTGRPSIDPELMMRMLLIGYCCGIRSERQLCYEVTMNLAYRWFCKLSITDKVPDHSTFCAGCPMKEQCCPNTEIRKITRSAKKGSNRIGCCRLIRFDPFCPDS